eukprot:5315401-Amphidinium_carterae.2
MVRDLQAQQEVLLGQMRTEFEKAQQEIEKNSVLKLMPLHANETHLCSNWLLRGFAVRRCRLMDVNGCLREMSSLPSFWIWQDML